MSKDKSKYSGYSLRYNKYNDRCINELDGGFVANNACGASNVVVKQKTIPVRIEHGRLKNIKISDGFKGEGSRITTSANRCVLFNILQNKFYIDFNGKNCLDLCCGSGIIGFEMMSMGAKNCVFIDCDRKKLQSIDKSLQKTGLQGQTLQCFLPKMPLFREQFDIIFIDPPYENDFCEEALYELKRQDLLRENGIIIVEVKDDIEQKCLNNFKLLQIRELKNGAKFWFLRY